MSEQFKSDDFLNELKKFGERYEILINSLFLHIIYLATHNNSEEIENIIKNQSPKTQLKIFEHFLQEQSFSENILNIVKKYINSKILNKNIKCNIFGKNDGMNVKFYKYGVSNNYFSQKTAFAIKNEKNKNDTSKICVTLYYAIFDSQIYYQCCLDKIIFTINNDIRPIYSNRVLNFIGKLVAECIYKNLRIVIYSGELFLTMLEKFGLKIGLPFENSCVFDKYEKRINALLFAKKISECENTDIVSYVFGISDLLRHIIAFL